MKVDLIDLKARYKEEKNEIDKCISKVLKKGSLILTKELIRFEASVCKYTGSKYCLGLNSGTDALMMSLWAHNISKGDEVITSAKSFIASVGAIVHVGARPVLVDVSDDLNINVDLIESKITKKTKAIMPVHWTGRVCDMDKINRIAKKYNLLVIEDSAQGMGSYYKGRHAGTLSATAGFSCHPLKNLNALGDSGYLVTKSKKIYEKVKLYRNHGLARRDDVRVFGVNSRLDSLNASVLSLRLKKLKKIIKKRRHNINIYRERLSDLKDVIIPKDNKNEFSSYVMFINRCRNRDKLQKFLSEKNIQSLIYYGTPLHKHVASLKLGLDTGDLHNSEKICKEVLALPHHQNLTENQINYVCDNILKFYKTH